jgi:predicted amidohydrolase YtcJ
LAETIAGYTCDAAYAEFAEKEKGRIRSGMVADMVVLSEDLFTLAPEKSDQVRAVLTLCGGRIVYDAMH